MKIVALLSGIIPKWLKGQIKGFCLSHMKLVSELSSFWMQMGFLSWLVGRSERMSVTVGLNKHGEPLVWNSGVKITRCRYLEEAGCKGACLHLCKGPTQEFFRNELGLPVYLKPNFEDNSCEMMFGVCPPKDEDDPAYKEKCYSSCSAMKFITHKS